MSNASQNTLIRLAADCIVAHVQEGGWLGASWPNYACGELPAELYQAAMKAAEEMCPDLWDRSSCNFDDEAAEEEWEQFLEENWAISLK